MNYVKMHGLGNDFVVIDDRANAISDPNGLAKKLCHRRTGIGADGLLLVCESDNCDAFMRIYNSDGSEANMCGNGIRCFAKYLRDYGIAGGADTAAQTRVSIETLAGRMDVLLCEAGNNPRGAGSGARAHTALVTINLGQPYFRPDEIPVACEGENFLLKELDAIDRRFTASVILLGVPHATVFVEDISAIDIEKYGRAIENNPLFPSRVNVNFAQVVDKSTVIVRTWERGAGATYACGTGSASVAVCCAVAGKTAREVDISLMLGTLHIEWTDGGDVYMTGPAQTVFAGEWDLD